MCVPNSNALIPTCVLDVSDIAAQWGLRVECTLLGAKLSGNRWWRSGCHGIAASPIVSVVAASAGCCISRGLWTVFAGNGFRREQQSRALCAAHNLKFASKDAFSSGASPDQGNPDIPTKKKGSYTKPITATCSSQHPGCLSHFCM